MTIAVTDHAVERYLQRVRGTLDARTEIAARAGEAWAAGSVSREPPPGAAAQRGSVYVRAGDLVFVCVEDRPRGELVVVTVWEEGEDAAVPRRFTDAVDRAWLSRGRHPASTPGRETLAQRGKGDPQPRSGGT